MIFQFHLHFLDLWWSILGLKHVFLDPWCIPIGSCFQSFGVIMFFNSDLKLPLWEQSLMIFLLHLHFLDLSGSILVLKHVIFGSLIHTDWILFSILLGHYFAQFRSEIAIRRTEFNDFSTSSAFFGSFMINFGSGTCIFRSLIYTDWILFSILLGHYAVQFRSETAIMRAEFNDFPTSSPIFGSFMINFGSETCIFRFMIYTNWILFSILLGHCFAQFRSETAIMGAEFNDFPTSSGLTFHDHCFQSFWVIVLLFNSDLKLPLWEQSLMIFLLHLDFFGPFMINFGSETCIVFNFIILLNSWNDIYQFHLDLWWCFQSFWVIMLCLNSDLKLPLWVFNPFGSVLLNSDLKLPLWAEFNDFPTSSGFFWPFMINFGSETCIFKSMIYTDWILFSILLGHYAVQFRSETAIMRAELNDFPTSSPIFGSFMINFGSETCIFRFMIYTNWILFSILLGHCFAQFRSETAIMGAEFNDFPTSSGFFWPFMINFGSETCTFRSLIYTIWIMFSILLGHYAVQFRSETAIMRADFNDFPTSSPFFGSIMINFGSETCIFRFMIYTKWILFSILLGHCFAQFRSETAIMRAEFNNFPTSSGLF